MTAADVHPELYAVREDGVDLSARALDWDFDPETEPCPQCGGDGVLLGVLGRRVWLRCRDCGIDFHREEVEL